MYHRWLDRWDERRAQRGEELKKKTRFDLGAELAFPGAKKVASISEFCTLADEAVAGPTFFDEPDGFDLDCEWKNGWITFPSGVCTKTEENNVVWAKVTESRPSDQALVIFHHWNATSRYRQMGKFFSRRGTTVVEMAMP